MTFGAGNMGGVLSDLTAPGRIPVSTGTVNLNTPGSITTKPSGVSGQDWKKYLSLSDKIANRARPISAKNQAWYDNFTSQYGTPVTPTPPPPPGGGTAPPGGVVNDPTTFANIGLLTRPYDNPFERRDLWQLFPQQTGGG